MVARDLYFSNNSPNPFDPLFIELRIKPDINNNVYTAVANLIQSNFQQTSEALDDQSQSLLGVQCTGFVF